ncbi:MAG: TonB-dependent receptor [Bacteroidia bacterium]
MVSGQIVVSGTLTDAQSDEPLAGGTVRVKNTTTGALTDVSGGYTIRVADTGAVLIFSYVGYATQEVAVGRRTRIDMALEAIGTTLDEVVFVGYTTQKKENLTGAITTISAADLAEANATSLSRALQGRTAGVNITSTSGAPGGGLSIRVRGVGSITNSAQPLVVIDGVIAGTGALANINPQDIESVSVLKDAASSAIYGARGSNGVILVKTKQGASDRFEVSYNGLVGFATLPRRMDIMNADEYRAFYAETYRLHNETYPNDPRVLPPVYTDSAWQANGRPDSDWQSLIADEPGVKQNHYLSFSGGNKASTYMFSMGYVGEQGFLKTVNQEQMLIRLNSEHKIGKRVRVGENLAFTWKRGRNNGGGGVWLNAAIASPILPVYNPNAEKGYQGPDANLTGPNDRTNPLAELMLNENTFDENSVFGRVYAEVDIIQGLTFRTVLGGNFFNVRNTDWSPRYELGQRSQFVATLNESTNLAQKWQFDKILIYTRSFGSHNVQALAGHSAEKATNSSITASASDFRWESLRSISGGNPAFNASSQGIGIKTNDSYFGSVSYDYAGKYLFTGSVRRDGSSYFGRNNRYGVFPAMSVGWKISDDLFKGESFGWMDALKLRFGYGFNGNEPGSAFQYETNLSLFNEFVYTLGTDERPVFGVGPLYSFGSPELRWESAEMTNFGIDFVGFDTRLEFYAEYYIKNQNDLITQLPLQLVYGLSNDASPPLVNLGDVRNSGFEFNLIYKDYSKALKYQISANLTTVKNVVDFVPNPVFNGFNVSRIGNSIGSYWGFVAERLLTEADFVQDSEGRLVQDASGRYQPLVPFQTDLMAPGDIKFTDLNRDGVVNAEDQTIIGKVIPDITYGFNVDLRYKMFDLSVLFQGVQNVDLYNAYRSRAGLAAGNNEGKDENRLRVVQNYWTPDNPDTDQTRLGLGDFNDNDRISTWWLEDASFLRMRNVQLGFSLPDGMLERLHMNNLRLYVGGENLITFTRYTGYDPELGSTNPNANLADNGAYPLPRLYVIGLNFAF